MTKPELLGWLDSLPRWVDHINGQLYVRSVLRSDGKQNLVYDKLFSCLPDWFWAKITYCVKPEELAEYQRKYPKITRWCYQPSYEPTRTLCGCGAARASVFEDAVQHSYTTIMLLDDDVKAIEAGFEDVDKAGNKCTHHTVAADHAADQKLTAKLLNAAMFVADYAMREHEVFGLSLRRQRFSGDKDVALTAFAVDKGSHPRQFMFWNMRNVAQSDIATLVPQEVYWHGEDIVCGALCAKYGLKIGSIQFLMFDFMDEQTSSSIRSTDEYSEYNKWLHNNDDNTLAKYGLLELTKPTKLYEDGTTMYRTLNWKAIGRQGFAVSVEEML